MLKSNKTYEKLRKLIFIRNIVVALKDLLYVWPAWIARLFSIESNIDRISFPLNGKQGARDIAKEKRVFIICLHRPKMFSFQLDFLFSV